MAKKKSGSLFILIIFALCIAGAYYLQQKSPVINKEKFEVWVMTEPRQLKFTVTPERIYVEETKGGPANGALFIEPAARDKNVFWNDFKYYLSHWRYNPFLAFKAAFAYIKSAGRTNIYPHDFIFIMLDLLGRTQSDFTVNMSGVSARPAERPLMPFNGEEGPLMVEILNASGKKGAAHNLRQYLRNLNEAGLLSVDVWQTDNYPREEEFTKIVYFGGKERAVKQLSVSLGLGNKEIFLENSSAAVVDARIIIGYDFRQPK